MSGLKRSMAFLVAAAVVVAVLGSTAFAAGPLRIQTTSLVNGRVGVPYSQTMAGNGGTPPYSFAITGGTLPPGLSLTAGSGNINGTPTASGVYAFTAEITDAVPATATKALSITIPADLSVLTTSLPSGQVSAAYSQTLSCTGGATPYTWSRIGGSLPAGLSLTTAGVISGTPTTYGTSSFTVQVVDTGTPYNDTATQALSIVVIPVSLAVTTTSLPAGQIGVAYSQFVATSGGATPLAWSIGSGALPGGLTIEAATGEIHGAPTTAGNFTFDVQVADSWSPANTANKVLSIVIPDDLTVGTASLPDGQQSVGYSQSLNASGGVGPYAWSISTGSLPTGLSLASSGAISGTPSVYGTFSFTVSVTDAQTPADSAMKALSILVTPAPLVITTSSMPGGKQTIPYSHIATLTGGASPFTWEVSAGELPSGLSLNPSTGEISGTPTMYGLWSFTLRVTDSWSPNNVATQPLSITVDPADLVISTTTLPDGQKNVVYSAAIVATGGIPSRTFSVASGSLPPGLSLDGATGAVSGTPTQYGIYGFIAQVVDSQSPIHTATKGLTITVAPETLTMTTASLAGGKVDVEYAQSLASVGGAEPVTWSIASGSLPAGLSLDGATGNISGTPTACGIADMTVQVADSWSPANSATKALSIAIAPVDLAVTTASLASGQKGVSYSETLAATGGAAPLAWSVSAGSLPAGLSVNASTGEISGTPTEYGAMAFTVEAVDSWSPANSATAALSITIAPETLAITTSSLSDGQVAVAYSQTIGSTGGAAPLGWSIADGTLPAGVTLDGLTGEIAGTPSACGTSNFTVEVVDAWSPAATVTQALSITVQPASFTIATTSLPDGLKTVAYSQTLAVTGGAAPITWSLIDGTLPDGLSLTEATGEISGTPTTEGTSSFTVQAVDSWSPANTATAALSIAVSYEPVVISTTSLSDGTVGAAYSQTLAATGGTAPYTWEVAVGSLPAGLSLNGTTGEIGGTPTAYGLVSFTVQASDSGSPAQSATQALEINVAPTAVTITTTSLPNAPSGVAYSQLLAATGGATPYMWAVDSGALPTGLSLNTSTGRISGTPTVGGAFDFTVSVTDSWTPANSATKALSISVSSGPTYQYVCNDPESSTTNTNYVVKANLTFTPPTADDWIVFGFCEFKCPNVNYATFVQLFIDGMGEGQNTRKPVDPTDYLPFISVKIANLSAGAHTITLKYRSGNASAAAYVRNARICAVRKAALEFYNVAYDNAQPLTINLQDIVTLSWTPQFGGNYLVISTGEINATTTVSTDLQTIYNGVVNDEGIMRAADNGDYTTFMSFNYCANTTPGVPITHKISGRKLATDPINHYIRRARILALKLSGGRFRDTAAGYGTEQVTTQTTFQQAVTTSWTVGVNGNWLFLNSARTLNTSTSAQTEIRVQLNDAAVCGQQLMKPKDVTDLLNYSSIDVRALAASPRKVDMDFRTSVSTGTAKVRRLRFYGLPLDAQ